MSEKHASIEIGGYRLSVDWFLIIESGFLILAGTVLLYVILNIEQITTTITTYPETDSVYQFSPTLYTIGMVFIIVFNLVLLLFLLGWCPVGLEVGADE